MSPRLKNNSNPQKSLFAKVENPYIDWSIALYVAIGAFVLYFGLVTIADYTIYKHHSQNFLTKTMEKVFPYPAASVGQNIIPLSRFRQEVAARQAIAERQKLTNSEQEIEGLVINQLINKELYAEELAKRHISVTDKDVDTKLQSIYTEAGGKDKLLKFLQENYGGTIQLPEFRRSIRESLEEAAVRNLILQEASVRHILVAVPENATDAQVEAARQKALTIKAKITDPSKFSDVAKQYSEDLSSRDKGGDIGSTSRGNDNPVYFSQDFENAIFSIPIGQVSDPVRSRYGWHIIIVDKRIGTVNASLKEFTLELRAKSKIHTFIIQ